VSFYPVPSPVATAMPGEEAGVLAVPAEGAVMIALRASDLVSPAGRPLAAGERSALAVGGTKKIRGGELVVFCKVVAVAPAVIRRDGLIQAQGKPCDHARLGVAEERLDEIAGPDAVGRLAATVTLKGKVKGTARRLMSTAFALRAILLMTLMPDADYAAVMTALAGDLAAVPWNTPWRAPSATVLSTWRAAIGPGPLEDLQQVVLAAACAEHRDHDYRAVRVGDLRAGSVDGTLTRMPDTPANRKAYGSSGTADDSAPYPQLRSLPLTDASTRATLGVVSGPAGGDKAEAEQKLLDKAMTEWPRLFTPDRLWIMDRNFPGAARISRLIARTHVLIRVKSDIPLRRAGGFLSDGSYLADICGGGVTVRMRVVEYYVEVEGQDVPELFCLITDLTDWRAYPAWQLAAAYKWRWDGSETALREGKSALNGAGPSTGPMFRSQSPELIRQEHAAWITATELVRGTIRTAARHAAPAVKGHRAGLPVHPREVSFTAARRAAIASATHGTATAGLPRTIITAGCRAVITGIGRRRIQVDRGRHRDHKTKTRPSFPNATRQMPTRTAKACISICAPA
jgi:hypothetical protein